MYKFLINPQEYSRTKPQRTTVYKTDKHVVVEDYGTDIGTITFSGTTGYKTVNGKNGYHRLKELENVLQKYADSGIKNNTALECLFHNFTDRESYVVHLGQEGLEITRDASSPLLYNYSVSLLILRNAGDPGTVNDPIIGNKAPSVPEYKTTTETINPNGNKPVSNGAVNNIGSHTGITKLQ